MSSRWGAACAVVLASSVGGSVGAEEPRPAPRWSAATPVTGSVSYWRIWHREWKRNGKPRFRHAPRTEPHAVAFGNRGALRRQTGVDVLWIDGARAPAGRENRVLRLTPGEHELVLMYRRGTSAVSETVIVTRMSFEAGRAYRFTAAADVGAFAGVRAWVPLVEVTEDVDRLDLR